MGVPGSAPRWTIAMTGFPSPNTLVKLPVITVRLLLILTRLAAAEELDNRDFNPPPTQGPHRATPLGCAGASGAAIRQDHVGCLLGDHQRGGVGVGRDHARHHR